jgi:hypothetical protein
MPKTMKPLPAPDPRFAPVIEAFADDERVIRKRMFSTENTLTVNGKIFAMLVKGKLVVKLPKARVDEIVREGDGVHFDPGHGRLMKEWVTVETDDDAWIGLAQESHRFVGQASA